MRKYEIEPGNMVIGVREDGNIRAVCCIDEKVDVKEAKASIKRWVKMGRSIKCVPQSWVVVLGEDWCQTCQGSKKKPCCKQDGNSYIEPKGTAYCQGCNVDVSGDKKS
jgi:hypothetical protein